MRDRVAICIEKFSRTRTRSFVPAAIATCMAVCVAGCSGGTRHDPVELFASAIALDGTQVRSVSRTLEPGVYLVEARERDIDARVTVATPRSSSILENRLPRHGTIYKVVSLETRGNVRVEVTSADHRTKAGAVAVRILRWSRAVTEPAGELESGYVAESTAAELDAAGTPEESARAADKLHEALAHFEAANDDAARAEAAYSLAYIQYRPRAEYAATVRACEAAAESFARVDDAVGEQNAATMRAAAEIELAANMNAGTQRAEQRALYAEADRRLEKAAEFFTQHQLPVRAQYAVNMRAVRATNVGDYAVAATLFTRAVEMARANHDVREEARSLANVAAVNIYRGYMSQAAQEYEALLPLLDRASQQYQYAAALGNFGMALIALGDFDRALSVHNEALLLYEGLNREYEKAVELSALGGLYFRMGDTARAANTLQLAIKAQERLSDSRNLSETLRVAGNVASAQGRQREALAFLRRSAEIDGNPVSVARTRVRIASELRLMGDLAAAEQQLVEPLQSSNPLVQASATEERGRIRAARHDLKSGIEDLRAADRRYAELGLDLGRVDTSTALSRALLESGDARGAAAAANVAVAIVGRTRIKSTNPEWRARFLDLRYAPYEASIEAEVASGDADAAWRSFVVAEVVRGRSLADELIGAASVQHVDPEEEALRLRMTANETRLESAMHDADIDDEALQRLRREIEETRAQLDTLRTHHGVAASTAYALPSDLARLQRSLPADRAVLAYFVGDHGSHAWLLTRSTLRHAALPARADLERSIAKMQKEVRGGAIGAATRALGVTLLGDLVTTLRETHLLILADGPLNNVPFAALPVPGDAGRETLNRFILGSAPSLAVALSAKPAAHSTNSRVAVIYDPIYAPDDRRLVMENVRGNFRGAIAPSPNNLTRLPYSALEASAVVRAFGPANTIQLSGYDATTSRVLALPSKSLKVLHFALHAAVRSGNPEQSALFLTEYAKDLSRLPQSRLTAGDIARSGLRADVVVLSGCETGDGDALRGEGVLGLTYGFLANGSHSVVASLWPIEDAATARFMNEFYRVYRVNGRAAESLRAAQVATRGNTPPNVWSSFVVRANEFP